MQRFFLSKMSLQKAFSTTISFICHLNRLLLFCSKKNSDFKNAPTIAFSIFLIFFLKVTHSSFRQNKMTTTEKKQNNS